MCDANNRIDLVKLDALLSHVLNVEPNVDQIYLTERERCRTSARRKFKEDYSMFKDRVLDNKKSLNFHFFFFFFFFFFLFWNSDDGGGGGKTELGGGEILEQVLEFKMIRAGL